MKKKCWITLKSFAETKKKEVIFAHQRVNKALLMTSYFKHFSQMTQKYNSTIVFDFSNASLHSLTSPLLPKYFKISPSMWEKKTNFWDGTTDFFQFQKVCLLIHSMMIKIFFNKYWLLSWTDSNPLPNCYWRKTRPISDIRAPQ